MFIHYLNQSVIVHMHTYLFTLTVQAPILSVQSTTATTISLSWTSAGSVGDSYKVMWQRNTSGDCPDEHEGIATITDGSTSYNITGLEEFSTYVVIIIVLNANEIAISNNLTGITEKSGTKMSLLELY